MHYVIGVLKVFRKKNCVNYHQVRSIWCAHCPLKVKFLLMLISHWSVALHGEFV